MTKSKFQVCFLYLYYDKNLNILKQFFLKTLNYLEDQKKCRALVLSGGGDKGSYQAAAFIEFTKKLAKEDISYDVVAGVSVGSLNGSGLATYKPGDEKEAAEWILGVWNDLTSSDVFTNWPGGLVEGILDEQGIFNNTNLENFFKNKLGDRFIEKRITIGTADMSTGTFQAYDYYSTNLTQDYVNHVLASTAMPFAFPPLIDGNRTLLDGGVVWKMDIPGAIRRCKEIVQDEKDIIIDVIMTAQSFIETVENIDKYTTLEHYIRSQEIKSFHADMKILNDTVIDHPDVNFRYILGPSVKLTISPIPLDFSKKHLEFCMKIGKEDADRAIQLGPGGYMEVMMEYSRRTKKGEILDMDQMIQQKLDMLNKSD